MKHIVPLAVFFASLPLIAAQYPSANTAIVLPGLHENGVDLSGSAVSSQDVIDWEINHSDLVFGSYAGTADNQRTQAVGYMYNQKLEMNSNWLEHELREKAEQQGIDFEDLFLHFSEDTVLAEVDKTHGENTILNRKPMIVGYTANEDHAGFWLYQTPPWDADVFENFASGGALYVYHSEPFDRLVLKFSKYAQGGEFWVEYPSSVDGNGKALTWERFTITKDKTLNMTKNQNVIWSVPTDWVRATTHDGSGASYGGGQYFGSTYLRDGGKLYVARIRWSGSDPEHRPRLKEVKLKNSFQTVKLTDAPTETTDGKTIERWRKVRGFDESADLDGDNYLSWSEYKNRSNKQATARFRWESRVIPFGRMWNQNSSWALTNLANPNYLALMSDYYASTWSEQGLNGAYNDDTNKLLGPNQFHVYSGGRVAELDVVAGSEAADQLYQTQFAKFLQELSVRQSNSLISVNVGTANLLGRNGQQALTEAASLYLREHYVFPSTGFSGYAGIAKYWDNSVFANDGRSVIFQASTRYGRVQYFGNSQDNWQQDQYAALAIYYLNSHPELSFFNQWNNGYVYGSDNTSSDNFWQSGVPKNMAYQPSALLAVDLGQPAEQIPEGYEPIPLMLSTETPYPADFTVVGNTSQTSVVHADLPEGISHLLPTYTYFLYQSESTVVTGGPEEMVLAREFTKGKVLYRTDFFGKSRDFYQSEPVIVYLDTPMRVVGADGQVGDYVEEVTIGGYQGLFLLY
ncbi:hypothetical protein [Vibrio maritimus]|uniref:hypothetical protein n=1 Tax=Vibrio maritimus TaxID=990268 RepID=UPI001F3FD329|nr:hypothetical protein [Vibrio maritimus]